MQNSFYEAQKSSHKSPSKKKAGKTADFQTELKSMDDKWSERFSWLEAMFLARNFQVPVELVQKSEVVVTDRPFIPPVKQPTAVLAPWPVETPGASSEMQSTGQDSSLPLDVQPRGSASQIFSSGRPEVQHPGPTAQPATVVKKLATSLTGSGVSVEEPAADVEQFSDRALGYAGEGEVSVLESSGPDRDELVDVDQELSAEQTYRDNAWCEVLYSLE